MIEKFRLKNNEYLDQLHDGVAHKIFLKNNRLTFDFGRGLSARDIKTESVYPYKSFQATYVLDDDFDNYGLADFTFFSKILRKNALQYCGISEAVRFVTNKSYTLQLLYQAFNSDYCWLFFELYLKDACIGQTVWRIPTKEVIYEWEKLDENK